MQKKYYGVTIAVAITLCLGGCGGKEEASAADMEAVMETRETIENDEIITEDRNEAETVTDAEPTDTGETEVKAIEIEIAQKELPESETLAFVKDMKIGWNLGNTFDAIDCNWLSDEMQYESSWCGTVTTKEMIDALKEAGFRTIRIPVSWHNHLTDENHTISEAWINRVQEVVDYAIDDDMYVIINIHHDFSKEYIYPSSEYLEQSKSYVTDIWEQIAERFKDYDEHLIMESLNEPRLIGTDNEWWLDIKKEVCIDSVQCINELNQTFVEVVRASGGNNADRYLMVPGYAASLEGATNQYFALPEDIDGNQDKILVSVHAYTPYAFALQASGESGSVDSFSADRIDSTKDIDYLMDELYEKYIQNGTGVVIGEFGARDKNNNIQARTEFAAYYIKAARARGISCCWWDNNAFAGDGENFGLFNRQEIAFSYPEILENLMANCE